MLDQVERFYFLELERKDRLYQQAVFTAALAGIYFPIMAQVWREIAILNLLDLLSLSGAILAASSGVVFLTAFFEFFGHDYLYVDDPENLLKVHLEAVEYDRHHSIQPPASELLENDLAMSFARSASHNRSVNQRKARLLFSANKAIFCGLLFASVSYTLRYIVEV